MILNCLGEPNILSMACEKAAESVFSFFFFPCHVALVNRFCPSDALDAGYGKEGDLAAALAAVCKQESVKESKPKNVSPPPPPPIFCAGQVPYSIIATSPARASVSAQLLCAERRAERRPWLEITGGDFALPAVARGMRGMDTAVVVKTFLGSHFGVGEFTTHLRTRFSGVTGGMGV